MLLLEGEEVGRDAGGKLREARKRQGPVVVELVPGIPGPEEPDLRARGMGKDLPQHGDLLLRGTYTYSVTPYTLLCQKTTMREPQTASCGLFGSGQSKWKNFPRGWSTRS
jgi:hypothetical protein